MKFFSAVVMVLGLAGFVWNLFSEKRRIDGSSVSLLFTFLVGFGLLFDPESITLPFVNYQKKAKEEYVKAAAYSNSIKELLAIQIWNQGRLPDDASVISSEDQAIKIFKTLYGENYKSAMKSLSLSNTLLISDEEKHKLGLENVKTLETAPFSEQLINEQ